MSEKHYITHNLCHLRAEKMARDIVEQVPPTRTLRICPVPRGGVPVAYLLLPYLLNAEIVDQPSEADVIVDDLIDSGSTMERYSDYDAPFFALFDKRKEFQGQWLVFPWEHSEEGSAEDIATRLLQFIGEDPNREGLKETPKRWLKAMKHWMSGYGQDPADVMKVFEDGAEGCDEMVLVRDIPFFSHCEHHIAPIIGVAHIAYIPNGKIIGLSKLARLVDMYARRLQVQERHTNQVADALQEHLEPLGCGVVIEARHLCMESRGIQKQGNYTITSALRGVFKDDGKAREEFLMLTRGDRNRSL